MRFTRQVIGCFSIAAPVFMLAMCLPGGSGAGTRLGSEPVSRLLTAKTQAAAGDLLKRELPGAGGRLLLVSPHDYLPELLLPLRRSGILAELVVVLPFDNVLAQGHLDDLRAYLAKNGAAEDDRKSLAIDNGVIRGRLDGMSLTLCPLTAIPGPAADPLVVLDTAFFPAVYRNEVKTPMLELARKLILTLRDRGVGAKTVLIFDAVGRPDFPLEHGYLASLLGEMLSDPGRFSGSPPEKWRLLAAADHSNFFSQYPDAMMLYKRYLGMAPNDASACYKIALMAMRDLDVDMSLQWVNRAVEADPLYARVFSEIAGRLHRKELFEDAERVLLAGLSKFPKDPLFATNLSALYVSRGEALREAGETAAAGDYFRMAAETEGADPALRERAGKMADAPAHDPPKTPE